MHKFGNVRRIVGGGKLTLGVTLVAGMVAAMPTKEELKSAEPIVLELMTPELKALKEKAKTQAEVAASALELARQAKGEAAKLLLYRGSLDLFARAGNAEKTVETLKTIRGEISDLPIDNLSSYAEAARKTFRKSNPKTPDGVLGLACAEAGLRARVEADLKFTRRALRKTPSDASLQRRLAELLVVQGEWAHALETFAKVDAKTAKVVENETEQTDLPAAADFWYDYKPVVSGSEAEFRRHAAELYARCVKDNLLEGLLKTRAERRVAELEKTSGSGLFVPGVGSVDGLYLVVDLSGGTTAKTYPVTYLQDVPKGGWTDEYKTSKLVLRRIEPAVFLMGDPSGKSKYTSRAVQVTLTKPYYIGVFEVTQKQWELVTGTNPADAKGDMRPVERVSYDMIRGKDQGATWPMSAGVDADSFLGAFRARTKLAFDLPTEAQWEYACRAETTSLYNNGGDSEDDLRKLGRYRMNQSDRAGKERAEDLKNHRPDHVGGCAARHTVVGSYLPNAWGLYDLHGNVLEWCLDWKGDFVGGCDPQGAMSGADRILRGGSWYHYAFLCRALTRSSSSPAHGNYDVGFRLCCSPESSVK